MNNNNQITKQKVHEVFKKSTNGGEIAKAVRDYFKLNFNKITPVVVMITNDDIVEVAKKIFNSSVDTPRAGSGTGQGSILGLGL